MSFIHNDFLLSSGAARTLYHDYAAKQPIIDYHCHINPAELALNQPYENMTQAWIAHDHYKWTLMRTNGIDEAYVTGDADDYEKFLAFAKTLPYCAGNPVFHWSHLELFTYFGYDGLLTPDTAAEVWALCNERLNSGLRPKQILDMSRVEMLFTTDDPTDDLHWHRKMQSEPGLKMYPAFRPDPIFNPNAPGYLQYIQKLGEAAGMHIVTGNDVWEAVLRRMDAFSALGCTVSDHAFITVPFNETSETHMMRIWQSVFQGESLGMQDIASLQTWFLLRLGAEYSRRGWMMQLHFGVLRDVNTAMFGQLGPDAGGDIIYNGSLQPLSALLDRLNRGKALPKTILYSADPSQNAAIDSLIGCFQAGGRGRVQHGCAWWFNDSKQGLERYLAELASQSVLGISVGMLTDSRSFLSYARHDYFRRLLCGLVGRWIENGEYPKDFTMAGSLVADICYHNIKNYLNEK